MDTTKLTLFSLISKGIALKILTLLFLVCNIQVRIIGQYRLYCIKRGKKENVESQHYCIAFVFYS